jgi:hypothetical protein
MKFELLSFRYGIAIATFITSFNERSLLSITYDGYQFQIDFLFIHLYTRYD